ncbi:MAG: Mur ligase domain-containing protein [Candidatus Saccharibacteria bacterium]|nr:Mur ligase domain-containing protein [Candidatus Saccharibacteria bacterium]
MDYRGVCYNGSMKIYISGIAGTGVGPLALLAKAAGHGVYGSDKNSGMILPELDKAGIDVEIGNQDGSFLERTFRETGVDWFVHTSALPENHPEILKAKQLGIKISKRDEFLNYICKEENLWLVGVAGTHGKTTTTAMIVWTAIALKMPVAYLVGTTLGFAPTADYSKGDQFLVLEADEYDRNFLAFNPEIAVIPTISYDHPDIYPTENDYNQAFEQFKSQSKVILEPNGIDEGIELVGRARKIDAGLALRALEKMWELSKEEGEFPRDLAVQILNAFPGVGRRFERLIPGVYTDYAHHPEEIAATINLAEEEAAKRGLKGVVAVYEPHQNTRQHEVREGYKNAFEGVNRLFWLPTYLTREDESLSVITPAEFIQDLEGGFEAEPAEAGDVLGERLCVLRDEGYLILLMTAGPADGWLRDEIRNWE